MKILITGGAGFIGRHLTQLLQTKSHQIVWLDNLDPQIHGDYQDPKDILPHPDIKLIVGNVCDRSAWLQAIQGVDAIVHFAAQTGDRKAHV